MIDDQKIRNARPLSVRERLERLIYLDGDAKVEAKFIKGKQVI